MRFVDKWAYACAYQLAGVLNENHQRRAVYYYGFIIIFGSLVKGLALTVVSLLLGIFRPIVIIAIAFGLLRLVAGGYHMDTYGKCLLVSMVLFISAGVTAQYSVLYWKTAHLITLISVVFVFGLYAIIRYAPRDTPNKRITEIAEIRKFKRLSLIYLGVWLTVTAGLVVLGFRMAVLALCFAVSLEIFTIIPTGQRFFDFIKEGLSKRGAVQH